MGNAIKNQEEIPSSLIIEQPRELSPQERWDASEKTQQDLIILLTNAGEINQCANTVYQFIRSITKREKYQNYVIGVLDFLRSEIAINKMHQDQRKEMFTYLSRRLKHSFFIEKEFNESHFQFDQKPAEKMYFLYEYYWQSEELLQKAIFFNYPTIFTEFRDFMRFLMENQALITNQIHLFRLILAPRKVQEIKEYFQVTLQTYTDSDRQQLLQEAMQVHDLKEIYLNGVEELMDFNHADVASSFLRNMQAKGYQFSEGELEYNLKIEIYALFLYQLAKLSLTFHSMQSLSINEIFHYFFTNHELEETPRLIKCFDIFHDPSAKWKQLIFAYLFSPGSHLSTLIRLLERKLIQFQGSEAEFDLLQEKIKRSRCDIGRYSDSLTSLALLFPLPPSRKNNYKKLIKLIEIYHVFNINADVEILYDIVYADWINISQSAIVAMSEKGLDMLRNIINHYFSEFQVKQKTIQFEEQQFCFSSVFEMVKFIQFVKSVFLNNFISNSIAHQIFFKELIAHQCYIQIKALLSQQRIQEFDIDFETIGLIVTDHIIALLTTNKLRKIQETLKLLMNIIGIYPTPTCSHYILAYYNYLKYLEDRDIVLPLRMKESISTENLYYIVENYPQRIEQVDFNLLFTHQSCIKVHYTASKTVFVPIVTDQFLKFKVFLSNRAFSLKKQKLGAEVIEEVVRYEPPWISTELVKILRENSNVDDSFIAVAFNYCARGEDLQYILSLSANSKSKQASTSKLSLLKLKALTFTTLLEQDRYLVLTDELVINQSLYKNLVAELTFNEGEEIKTNHFLFFHLLTIEPERSFNYAVNYHMPAVFIVNFIVEGVKRGVIHNTNAVRFLLKFLFFYARKEAKKQTYISLKNYANTSIQCILSTRMAQTNGGSPYVLTALERMIKNYHIQRIATPEFLDLYLQSRDIFKFLYEEPFRKQALVALREQPMSKPNSKILKLLCEKANIDILDLSLYNLISKVNSKEQLDDQCWTIAQKLIHWGDDPKIAYSVIKRLSQKIEVLQILLNIIEFLRESQQTYRDIVTDHHLQIIRSLAAVEVDKNLYGIIPEGFFDKPIGIRPMKQRGMLSDTHRRILKESGCVENIFVLSKALYFMYDCSEEVEKIVLGQFSLRQEDSEEFQELRKKIRREAEGA